MLRNVYFEGEMGAKFVPHMEIDCETTAEVFSCLNANFDNFMPYLTEKQVWAQFLAPAPKLVSYSGTTLKDAFTVSAQAQFLDPGLCKSARSPVG